MRAPLRLLATNVVILRLPRGCRERLRGAPDLDRTQLLQRGILRLGVLEDLGLKGVHVLDHSAVFAGVHTGVEHVPERTGELLASGHR